MFSNVAFHSESSFSKRAHPKRPAGRALQHDSGVQMFSKGSFLVFIVLLMWDDGFQGHQKLVSKMKCDYCVSESGSFFSS